MLPSIQNPLFCIGGHVVGVCTVLLGRPSCASRACSIGGTEQFSPSYPSSLVTPALLSLYSMPHHHPMDPSLSRVHTLAGSELPSPAGSSSTGTLSASWPSGTPSASTPLAPQHLYWNQIRLPPALRSTCGLLAVASATCSSLPLRLPLSALRRRSSPWDGYSAAPVHPQTPPHYGGALPLGTAIALLFDDGGEGQRSTEYMSCSGV